jgi:outer membrane immunogenic protein
VEIGANYNYFRANAPPGQCGCFGLNGGSGTVIVNLMPAWSGVADIAVAFANNVDNTQQNITIINYLFGPRYTWRSSSRFVPYGQVLFGGAKENVNFEFTINRNSFGLLGGGGVTTRLGRRFGLTIGEVDYVYTRIPNAKNNAQNNIRVSTGITYRFGTR